MNLRALAAAVKPTPAAAPEPAFPTAGGVAAAQPVEARERAEALPDRAAVPREQAVASAAQQAPPVVADPAIREDPPGLEVRSTEVGAAALEVKEPEGRPPAPVALPAPAERRELAAPSTPVP